MTDPVRCTLTTQMRLEVTDPDALLAWAAEEVTRHTAGQSALHQEMTLRLVREVPAALRWAYTADPDCDPPGVVLIAAAVAVE